jgi:hypothetical protein
MDKRTKVDFSEHIVIETHFKNDIHNIDIWDLKLPDSDYIHRVTFINLCDRMMVKGDFGNWVFSREFHPSKNGGVSSYYWDEKLHTSSVQKSHKFDTDETISLINKFKDEFEEDFGREMNGEELEWVENLENSVYDEYEYIYTAYRENPSSVETEDIPFGEIRHFWLDVVYDAFDELCKRMNDE